MPINNNNIPNNWISKPLNGRIAKEKVALKPGIKKLKIVNEHTGQPAENKLNTLVNIPVPDSLLYFLISLNLNIIKLKLIPNKNDKIMVNKIFKDG